MSARAKSATGTAEVTRSYFDALAAQDVDAAVALWEPGAVDRFVGVADLRAPEEIRAFFSELFAAFPDFRFEVLDLVAEGERAAVRWRTSARFDGSGRFMGFAPNGRRVEIEGCDLLTVRGGLIRSNHAYSNGTELARQLGALPPAGSAAERAMTAAFNARTAIARRIGSVTRR